MTVTIDERKNNREKIWKTIRALREFSVDEVAILTGINSSIVSRYVYRLFQAGYVREGGMRIGEDGRRRRKWSLAKNPGPKAPGG